MRRVDLHDDEGATLVLVLVFLAVFGVLISLVLGQTDTSLKRTLVTRENEIKVYAADAGIEAGLVNLRNDDTACATSGTLLSTTVSGKAVTVTCQPVSGGLLGARGYALITTSPSDSLATQGGGGGVKKIQGKVFATSIDDAINLTVEGGAVAERRSASTCATNGDLPSGLVVTPSPPYRYSCTPDDWTALDPAPALGTAPALHASPTADRVITTGGSACHVFRPGTYSNGIVFGPRNYLTSGIYYFPTGIVKVQSQDVVAGAPASGDTQINDQAACATDAALAVTNPPLQRIQGTGAKIVLGGSARLLVDSPAGELEVYTRTGGPASEGTAGVSIYRVGTSPPASSPAWVPSTVPLSVPLIQVGTGNTPDLAVHGLIYVPGGFTDFNATNAARAQLVGGIVTGRLLFQSSSGVSGLNISAGSGPGSRRVQLVSVATGNGRPVTSRVVVDVQNDVGRTASVSSWLTDQG